MVVYKARAVLGDGNSTCKGPEAGPNFVSWRKDEKARVVESEISGGAVNELSLSLLLLPGSCPYCLSVRLPRWLLIDLSFPLCPSPSPATEVIGLITSVPYVKTPGVLRMKSKLCKETHRGPFAPGLWPTLLTSVTLTPLPR